MIALFIIKPKHQSIKSIKPNQNTKWGLNPKFLIQSSKILLIKIISNGFFKANFREKTPLKTCGNLRCVGLLGNS